MARQQQCGSLAAAVTGRRLYHLMATLAHEQRQQLLSRVAGLAVLVLVVVAVALLVVGSHRCHGRACQPACRWCCLRLLRLVRHRRSCKGLQQGLGSC